MPWRVSTPTSERLDFVEDAHRGRGRLDERDSLIHAAHNRNTLYRRP